MNRRRIDAADRRIPMLSEKGSPELRSMGALLDALGLKLSVDVKKAS